MLFNGDLVSHKTCHDGDSPTPLARHPLGPALEAAGNWRGRDPALVVL
jgi:hypothetical protein